MLTILMRITEILKNSLKTQQFFLTISGVSNNIFRLSSSSNRSKTFLIDLAKTCCFEFSNCRNISKIPSKLNRIIFCGFFIICLKQFENISYRCSSLTVQRTSSHVLKSFEKFGNGMVGPASNALLIISLFSESFIEKNSVILFFSIGVLRKSGKLARFTIMFPAKFSSDNIEI